jgi:phospholipid transport system substrate-binding protein
MKVGIGRRFLMVGVGLATLAPSGGHARDTEDPSTPIRALNTALLEASRAEGRGALPRRFATIAPAVDQAFDLLTVLRNSVGPRWDGMPGDDRNRLMASFRRYTICSFAANFDHLSTERFQVDDKPRVLSPTQVVVRSLLVPPSGAPIELSYVMRQGSDGWKAVDVLAEGAVSRVAVQRSDFRGLLANGGVTALIASLERKIADLTDGALA